MGEEDCGGIRQEGKLQPHSNCFPNSRFACIRLYWSRTLSVWERHSGVLQFTSHISLREWDRLRISNEVTAILSPILYRTPAREV